MVITAGANTKVPDMYGGGVFRDPKHKSNMYTFVQQRGVSIIYPESQKYKWYFCTHILGTTVSSNDRLRMGAGIQQVRPPNNELIIPGDPIIFLGSVLYID